MAQDEFVDLYAVLGIETDADEASIRKRATALYLDAQNNLDHRNPTKRLQWQQLYEVYLPQARHLLLDSTRRAEYNRYLEAYRSGKPLAEVAPAPVVVVESGVMEVVDEGALEMVEPDVDPEVLAAQREEVWGKWKSSLNFDETSPDSALASALAAPADDANLAAPDAQLQSAPDIATGSTAPNSAAPRVERRATPRTNDASERRPAIKTVALGDAKAASKTGLQRLTPEELKKQSHDEWERKRAIERDNLIGDAATGAGLMGSFIGGGGAFVIALITLFVTDTFLSGKNYPLGMSRLVFTLIGFAFSVGVAVIAATITSNKMRAKKQTDLNSLSLEELQRRR